MNLMLIDGNQDRANAFNGLVSEFSVKPNVSIAHNMTDVQGFLEEYVYGLISLNTAALPGCSLTHTLHNLKRERLPSCVILHMGFRDPVEEERLNALRKKFGRPLVCIAKF
jgi:hypothetical protein